jgi:hypothetical protein
MLRRERLLLLEVALCLFIEHVIVVILGDNALNLPVAAIVQLEKCELLLEHATVKCPQLVGLVAGIDFRDGVISELVVQVYVPTQTIHLNINKHPIPKNFIGNQRKMVKKAAVLKF